MARPSRTGADPGRAPRPERAPAPPVRNRGLLGSLIALAWASIAALPAPAAVVCEAPSGFDARGRLESADVVVLFRTVPPAIQIGQHFTVEAIVCAAPPVRRPNALRVDAYMPEHRHGMNYRPRVTSRGDGAYVAEGFLFHMRGLWQLRFEVDRGGPTERLAVDMQIE